MEFNVIHSGLWNKFHLTVATDVSSFMFPSTELPVTKINLSAGVLLSGKTYWKREMAGRKPRVSCPWNYTSFVHLLCHPFFPGAQKLPGAATLCWPIPV